MSQTPEWAQALAVLIALCIVVPGAVAYFVGTLISVLIALAVVILLGLIIFGLWHLFSGGQGDNAI